MVIVDENRALKYRIYVYILSYGDENHYRRNANYKGRFILIEAKFVNKPSIHSIIIYTNRNTYRYNRDTQSDILCAFLRHWTLVRTYNDE